MTLNHGLVALFCVALWGSNFAISKMGLQDFPPLFYCAMRFICVFPALLFIKRPNISLSYYLGVGFFWGILQFTCTFVALKFGAGAGFACIMLQTAPFFAVFIAHVVMRDRITLTQLIGMGIGFLGVVVTVWPQAMGDVTFGTSGLLLLAAASWGMGNIVFKKAAPGDSLAFTLWVAPIPGAVMLAASLYFDGPQAIMDSISNASLAAGASMLYNGWIAMALGGALWGSLLRLYSTSQIVYFSLAMPIFSFIFGYLLLGETVSATLWMGALLITFGLGVTYYSLPRFLSKPVE